MREEALDIKAEFWMKYQIAYEIDKIRIKNKKAVQKANISPKAKKQLASIWALSMFFLSGEMIYFIFLFFLAKRIIASH